MLRCVESVIRKQLTVWLHLNYLYEIVVPLMCTCLSSEFIADV